MLRFLSLVSLAIIVPIGFYSKFYKGPFGIWVNNSLGGVFYVIFWCLLIYLIFTKLKPKNIALGVFTVTCILEILQLWHPPFLEILRSSFVGRTILGNTFTFKDFPYYFIGSVIGYLWLKGIKKIDATRKIL
jgi:hypothetical protein